MSLSQRTALVAAKEAFNRLHEITKGEHDGSESEIADTINQALETIDKALAADPLYSLDGTRKPPPGPPDPPKPAWHDPRG